MMLRARTLLLVIVVFSDIVSNTASKAPNETGNHDKQDKNYCGQRSTGSKRRVRRVIGGKEAIKHSWPWQVVILNGSSLFCSGSIISPTWIITAAHCVDSGISMNIYAGKHRFNMTDVHEQKLEIESYSHHPKYIRGDIAQPGDYDLALIKLKKPITFSPSIHPICLPSKEIRFPPGHECVLSGWGTVNTTTLSLSSSLRELRIPIVAQDVCNSNESYGGIINKRYFCAGIREGGKDGCNYDSGGPLVCSRNYHTWYLTGLMAWGDGCAKPLKYGVYVNITEMLGYITQNITDLPKPFVPTPEATTSGKDKTSKQDSKERLFVAIICALCVIIVALLATLCMVHFHGKGYLCHVSSDKDAQQQSQSKSPKLIETNGKHNQQVSYV